MSHLAYRPEIDGMRAIAVLAVVLFHAGFGFPGGFVGVDVFFVISGYLITSLILKDLRANRFRFVEFWERRVRRIFPASFVMVAATMGAALFLLLPSDIENLSDSAIAQMLLTSNFYFLDNTDYFDGAAELKPLLHTWSLAVEEQFYLLFPMLLIFWKRLDTRQLRWRLSLLALISFVLSVWGSYAIPDVTFYMLPTRAWELMVGSILACSTAGWVLPRRLNEGLSWVGLGGVLFAMGYYDSSIRFPGANALLPCLGAALLIFTNSSGLTQVGRILSLRPLVMIGKLSYSLYLWHWPVLAILRCRSTIDLSLEQRLSAIMMSFVLAWLSWRFVETPLRSPLSLTRRQVYGFSTACSLVVISISIVMIQLEGVSPWCSPSVLYVLKNGEMSKHFADEQISPIGVESPAGEQGQFLLWGDSHARAMGEVVHEVARQHHLSGYIATRSATPPIIGTWRYNRNRDGMKWNQKVISFVKEKQIRNVVLVGRWSAYVKRIGTSLVDEETERPTAQSVDAVFRKGLLRTVRELEDAGATIWLLHDIPEHEEDVCRLFARRMMTGSEEDPDPTTVEEHRTCQARSASLLSEIHDENVLLRDPADVCFDESGHARMWDQNLPYYSDSNHLSRYGANHLLRPFVDQIIGEIAQKVSLTQKTPDSPATLPAIRVATEPPAAMVR